MVVLQVKLSPLAGQQALVPAAVKESAAVGSAGFVALGLGRWVLRSRDMLAAGVVVRTVRSLVGKHPREALIQVRLQEVGQVRTGRYHTSSL